MKHFILVIFLAVVGNFTVTAQKTAFGLTAGYLNLQEKVKSDEGDFSEDYSGFYAGAFADITVSESFHIVPGINYGNVEDSGLLFFPVMAKYLISGSGFYFQGGPQGTLILENDLEEIADSFGIDLSLGAGYNINENFFVDARYSFEITNRLNDDFDTEGFDIKYRINSLFVGVGYKF
ncbi:MAG: outer membrane beta-barrel protein [Flavobacteriaceae bacterium]|nr:outer membrane beta-barrel protein [Flavobacteriaceae bacterium]